MDVRFLNNIPRENAVELVVQSVAKLTMDYKLNIEHGLFKGVFGRDLTLQEFLVMMIIEKDIALKTFTKPYGQEAP